MKKKKKVVVHVEEEEDPDDSENLSIPTCCALLYSIATNDMNKLDGVLKILTPIAQHLDAPPKRGGAEELIVEQLVREKKARANTVRLVKVFNRQASLDDLASLEDVFQRKTGFPKGAFTAISASLNGDLDAFAEGIDEVTTTCFDPITKEPFYTDVRGLPALLVSLVRSDANADMDVFSRVLHLLGRSSSNKRLDLLMTELVPQHLQKHGNFSKKMDQLTLKAKVSDIMRRGSIKILSEQLKFDAVIDFIYGALVGGKVGRKHVIQSVKVFGFNEHLATDIMALSGGGSELYTGIVKDPVDEDDCFILPEDIERLKDAMDGVKSFVVQTGIHKGIDQSKFKSGEIQLKGFDLKHIRNQSNIPLKMQPGTVTFVQRDNPYDVFECLTEILTSRFQKHILSSLSKEDQNIAQVTMIHMLNILSSGYSALGRGRTGISVSLHTVARHSKELVISTSPSTKKWWKSDTVEGNNNSLHGLSNFRKNPYRQPDDLDLLDGIFLSQADAPSHNELLVNCIETLLDLLEIDQEHKNHEGTSKLGDLLAGIMCLVSPTDSQESETLSTQVAKKDLSKSLSNDRIKISPQIIGFCMGLARMDMTLVEDMGKQVGEFDATVVSDILVLISRLAPIIKSSSVERGDDENDNNANNPGKVDASKQRDQDSKSNDKATDSTSGQSSSQKAFSPELIFRGCVTNSGDTFMAFDEFETVSKILNLNYHDQALYELFLLGDPLGTGLLTVPAFSMLCERMIVDVTDRVMVIRKQTKFGAIVGVIVSVLTLLALIIFLLLGVETFSLTGGFAAGVSSTLFGGIGKLMDSLSADDDGGDDRDRGGGDVEYLDDSDSDDEDSSSGTAGDEAAQIQAALEEAISVFNADM